MKLDGFYSRALCSQLLGIKWIALDSWEPMFFFSAASSESSLPAFEISHYALLYIPSFVFNKCCLFCLQATSTYISPVSQSALSSRDHALGPLYHGCLVDCQCFLFTGWSRLLNLLPTLHHLHSPPSFLFSLCIPNSMHSWFSLHLYTAHFAFLLHFI